MDFVKTSVFKVETSQLRPTINENVKFWYNLDQDDTLKFKTKSLYSIL